MGRILVTGGAGNVGRVLADYLAARGHEVRAFDLPGCDFRYRHTAEIEVWEGDITDMEALRRAAAGADTVIHLAALLPPRSEWRREATMTINVGGTENVLAAMVSASPRAHLVFSSTVSVYGDTSGEEPPVCTSHPYRPLDHYGVSKMEAERLVIAGSVPYTVLRISGIAVPAFLAPPDRWPFQAEQRIEFVCRADVVAALAGCVENDEAVGRVLHVAGGPTWRMRGRAYVAGFNAAMGLPPEEGAFSQRPGTFDWYETGEAQAILDYQRTPYERYLELLEAAVEAEMGGAA